MFKSLNKLNQENPLLLTAIAIIIMFIIFGGMVR
jgi:hypothetical protein